MDNSPCWDRALQRVEPSPPDNLPGADLDHGHPADRPTDLDYGRHVRLATEYREAGYDDRVVRHRFAVEDPCFNALLAVSELALAAMARELGLPGAAAHRAGRRADPGTDGPALGRGGRPLPRARPAHRHAGRGGGVSGLIPLLVPHLPRDVVRRLHTALTGPRFAAPATSLVPSYDLTGHAFDPTRYWRGTGLVQHGLADRARTARTTASSRTPNVCAPTSSPGRDAPDSPSTSTRPPGRPAAPGTSPGPPPSPSTC